jgi:DNA-binding NarL/FixJ family response regulator
VSEAELCLQELAELEALLRQLTAAVLKLPAGNERRDILRGIAKFGQRISDLKQVARERRSSWRVADDGALSPLTLSDQAAAPKQRETANTEKVVTAPALTPRERQIMRLVSEGLSNKEIARRLNIVDGTIKVHLHNIFQKLHVNNRTVLAGLGTRLPSAAAERPECIDPLAADDGDTEQ